MERHIEDTLEEAMLYEKQPGGRVRCNLCSHHCTVAEGKKGVCHVRVNRGGTLRTLVHGKTIAREVDPIEKKPLFHFHPGSTAYSIATAGCNFRCRWCQNWQISQIPRDWDVVPGDKATPEEIVADTQRSGCRSIAYTYTEPTVFFEYAYETARLARESGIANVFVTNGYMSQVALETLHPLLDAANVDLKAFRDETYRKYVGARLEPVLNSMRTLNRLGVWLEVTTLVIPGINNAPEELRDAARFVAEELGAGTPWHISRFFPAHGMIDVPPTPVSTLEDAREIGRDAGLRYVYLGNVGREASTYCHACDELLIRRSQFGIAGNRVGPESCCPKCGISVAGIGMASS
jgi:pyruvate formate lyase activating enzyme